MTALARCGCCGNKLRTLTKYCPPCQRDLDDTAQQWARDHQEKRAA